MSEEFEAPLPPVEEPQKRNNTVLIIVIVVLVLLCCCCTAVGSFWYLWTYGDEIFGLTSRVLLQLFV